MESFASRFLIPFTYIACTAFSALYFLSKFQGALSVYLIQLHGQFLLHWGLFLFLNFLGVISLAVHNLVNFDKMKGVKRFVAVSFTIVLFIAFVTKVLYAVTDLYIVGQIQ